MATAVIGCHVNWHWRFLHYAHKNTVCKLSTKWYIAIRYDTYVTNRACLKLIHAIEKTEHGNEKSQV